MPYTVPTLGEEEVLTKLIWEDFLHLPTPVKLSMTISPFKVNTPGYDSANLQMLPGEVIARDDEEQRLWRLTGKGASRLYAKRAGNCAGCGIPVMVGQNFCSNCGLRLIG